MKPLLNKSTDALCDSYIGCAKNMLTLQNVYGGKNVLVKVPVPFWL